jgi:hypothetical protein
MSSIRNIEIDGRRIGTITVHRVSAAAPLRQWDLRQDRGDIPFAGHEQSDLDRAMRTPTERYFGTASPLTKIPLPNINDPIERPAGERYGIEKEGDTGI